MESKFLPYRWKAVDYHPYDGIEVATGVCRDDGVMIGFAGAPRDVCEHVAMLHNRWLEEHGA